MGQLADLSRPVTRVHYQRWGRDLPMRAISAHKLVSLQRDWAEIMDGEQRPMGDYLEFWAELLAAVVQEPCVSPQEWLEEASVQELTELGQLAMEVSGISYEQKKTDSSDPSTDSQSS